MLPVWCKELSSALPPTQYLKIESIFLIKEVTMMKIFSKNSCKSILSILLAFLCVSYCFIGCSSYQAENQNLPETEVVFPKTAWGMSVNDVKNVYNDLYDVSDEPEYESENMAVYHIDELDFYGMKMAATFSFYQKDGKTWLSNVSATSLDTVTDTEIDELKVNSDFSVLIDKYNEVNSDSSKASEEQQALLDKNREYLGLPISEDDRIPFYFLQAGGTTLNENEELHCQITFAGFGYLFTHYDLQTSESISE